MVRKRNENVEESEIITVCTILGHSMMPINGGYGWPKRVSSKTVRR